MVENIVTQNLDAPGLDKAEVLRYAGCKSDYKTDLPEQCFEAIKNELRYSVCWKEFSVKPTENGIDLGFVTIDSQYAKKILTGCDKAVVFAATVGIGIDRMIAKFGKISPTSSLMYQALGTERVESLCNMFCAITKERLAKKGYALGVRFSPGYGDISLSIQSRIFSALDVTHNIGVTLTEAFLMVPTKSVTAIAGISEFDINRSSCSGGCNECNKKDCSFRKV